MVAIAAALIAVVGTLLGHWQAGRQRDRAAQRLIDDEWRKWRHQKLIDALTELDGALTGHRRHQYLKFAARRAEEPDTPEAREARYEARSELTNAARRLRLVTTDPDLLTAARHAVAAALALGDADPGGLTEAGEAARQAHEAVLEAGAALTTV